MTWWWVILFCLGWTAFGAWFGIIIGKGITIANKKENHDTNP